MRATLRSKALVETWLDFLSPAQRALARRLQEIVLAAEPDLVESVKWGNLVFQLDGAALLAVVPYKAHVNVQIFNGSSLPKDLAGLEGSGRGLRQLKFKSPQSIDAVMLEMTVSASVNAARRKAISAWPDSRDHQHSQY